MSGSVYQTVPAPPAVANLPKIGDMPVPYVTVYLTDEQAAAAEDDISRGPEYIEHGPNGPAIGCTCVFGVGNAAVGKQCPQRQRQAVADRLCNVCGTPVGGVDALFLGSCAAELLNSGMPTNLASVVCREAPTHRHCLAYSALVCPRLRGEGSYRLAIVTGDYPVLDQWINPAGREVIVPHRAPREIRGHTVGVLNYHLAHLDAPSVRWTTLGVWMVHAAPKPYREMWQELTDDQPSTPVGSSEKPLREGQR